VFTSVRYKVLQLIHICRRDNGRNVLCDYLPGTWADR
jgi:hypothetical protein